MTSPTNPQLSTHDALSGTHTIDPRIEPDADFNQVRGNVVLHNGRHPDPVRAITPGADIVYDGTGTGNCFADNVFKTEFPAGITALFPCGD
jgi:hypothetical protein